MRISESKCFLRHGLCLLPQGAMRSLGKQDGCYCSHYCHGGDTQRVEVHCTATTVGQDKPASGTSTNWHNWDDSSQVLASTFVKAWWLSQAGNKREIPTLQSKQDLGLPASGSGVGGRKKAFEIEFSSISSLLERAWLEVQAVLFRPAFLQSWPLITTAAMQTRCCYGCISLFCSCVPALNPAFAFRSAVTAQRWQ